MELGPAQPGSVDNPAVEADRVVLVAQADGILSVREILDIVGEDSALGDEVAARPGGGKADPALESEGVGEGRALEEGKEARAAQLLHRLEIVVLAQGQPERL